MREARQKISIGDLAFANLRFARLSILLFAGGEISSEISIAINRLKCLIDENDLTGEYQAGFKSGYATVDHIFTLLECVQKRSKERTCSSKHI